MTNSHTASSRPRLWLAIGAMVAALSIAVLWPLQKVGQVCVMIYPAPPGCGAQEPRWVPLVAIGVVVALLSAQVIVYFTSPRPRAILITLAGAMVFVVIVAAAVVGISQTGIWDPYQPFSYGEQQLGE